METSRALNTVCSLLTDPYVRNQHVPLSDMTESTIFSRKSFMDGLWNEENVHITGCFILRVGGMKQPGISGLGSVHTESLSLIINRECRDGRPLELTLLFQLFSSSKVPMVFSNRRSLYLVAVYVLASECLQPFLHFCLFAFESTLPEVAEERKRWRGSRGRKSFEISM